MIEAARRGDVITLGKLMDVATSGVHPDVADKVSKPQNKNKKSVFSFRDFPALVVYLVYLSVHVRVFSYTYIDTHTALFLSLLISFSRTNHLLPLYRMAGLPCMRPPTTTISGP